MNVCYKKINQAPAVVHRQNMAFLNDVKSQSKIQEASRNLFLRSFMRNPDYYMPNAVRVHVRIENRINNNIFDNALIAYL